MISFNKLWNILTKKCKVSNLDKILNTLKDDPEAVVKVGDNSTYRYFYGGAGLNNLKVITFRTESGNTRTTSPAYVTQAPETRDWLDKPTTREFLLNTQREIAGMTRSDISMTALKDHFTMISSKLRPGQGYCFGQFTIDTRWMEEDGFINILRGGNRVYIPVAFGNLQEFIPVVDVTKKFDPANLTVTDEKIIKREHRQFTDHKRWLIVKQVASIMDNWVFSVTSPITAKAPAFYYTVHLDINHGTMAGHPFYIKDLLNSALKQIQELHPNSHIEFKGDNLTVQFKELTTTAKAMVDNQTKYRALKDSEPVIIFPELEYVAYGTVVSRTNQMGNTYLVSDISGDIREAKTTEEKAT